MYRKKKLRHVQQKNKGFEKRMWTAHPLFESLLYFTNKGGIISSALIK